MNKQPSRLLLAGILSAFAFSAFSCRAPEISGSPWFRRGLWELGQVKAGKVEIRGYAGAWNPPETLDLVVPGKARSAIGFADGGIAFIDGNQLRFWEFSQDAWRKVPKRTFKIPSGSRMVIDYNANELLVLGVATAREYRFVEGKGWREDRTMTMRLPAGWSSAFTFGFSSVGIARDGRATLYERRDSAWAPIPDSELELPAGAEWILGFQSNGIALIGKEKISFYMFNGKGWKEIKEAQFILQ